MPHSNFKDWPSASQLKNLFPKPSIDLWEQRVGKAKAESILVASQEFGTYVHTIIEKFLIAHQTADEGTFEGSLLCSIDEFLEAEKLELHSVEQQFTNGVYKIHGTPDLVCVLQDDPKTAVIVDWKTGSMIDGLAFIQLAVYAYLVRSTYGYQCRTGYFCKIDKETGTILPIEVNGLDEWAWLVEGLACTWWNRNGGSGDAPSSPLS